MKELISAGAIIFRRESTGQIKFLLLYHGRGYWNFPKGQLETGEKAMAAFLREVEEETGLKRHELMIVPGFRATDRFTYFERQDATRRTPPREPRVRNTISKIVILYLVETKKRDITVSEEHEGFAWFTPKDAAAVSKYKNTKEILKRAYDFVERNLQRHKAHPKGQGRNIR